MEKRKINCERCGEDLTQKDRVVWLELVVSTNRFVDPDLVKVPPLNSQGGFPFGSHCAHAVLQNGGRLRPTKEESRD